MPNFYDLPPRKGAVHMVIVFALTALVGGLITSVALWPLGMLIALAAAPFGASFLVVVVSAALQTSQAKPRSMRSYDESQNRPIIR